MFFLKKVVFALIKSPFLGGENLPSEFLPQVQISFIYVMEDLESTEGEMSLFVLDLHSHDTHYHFVVLQLILSYSSS